MVDYANPLTATFELQRQTITQSQEALSQGVEFQQRFSEAFLSGLEGQESAQRQTVALQKEAIHNTLDVVDENVPGVDTVTDDAREMVDEQFEQLLDNHEEAFDALAEELEAGTDTYDELALDYLDTVDDQIGMLMEAHAELETHSIETTEQITEQFEQLQTQVEDMQQQVREMQAQAVDAVDS